jgi:hypothetical protein
VIIAKTRQKTNKFEDTPSVMPAEVAREQTSAEWLEGIPPVLQTAVSIASRTLLFLRVETEMIIFKSWEMHRLEMADRKIIFSNNDFNAVAATISQWSIKQ